MAQNCIFVLAISYGNLCSAMGWWPQRCELSHLAWDMPRDGIWVHAGQSRLPSVSGEKSELLRQVRWTHNRRVELHSRSTHFSTDQESRWRWQLYLALKLRETNPGQVLSHPGCSRNGSQASSARLNFSFGGKPWQEVSLMTSLFCKTWRLGFSDCNGCSYLKSTGAGSVRLLVRCLQAGTNTGLSYQGQASWRWHLPHPPATGAAAVLQPALLRRSVHYHL